MEGVRNRTVFNVAFVLFVVAVALVFIFGSMKFLIPQPSPLIVGTNSGFPPFEERKGDTVIGFDIDLAQEIADASGRELIVRDFPTFDALLPSLQQGTIDMVAAGLTITKARENVFDFSNPYFDASQSVLALSQSEISYSSPGDLKGTRIAYQKGTTSETWADNNLADKVNVADTRVVNDVKLGIQFLRAGSFDALILDTPVAMSYANSSHDLSIAGTIPTNEYYGFAVKNGDPDNIVPTINKILQEMEQTGEYDQLVRKWFGGE